VREADVARYALEVAEAVRRQRRGTHVQAVRLAIGPRAEVDDELLRSAFAALSRGGPAEGADLRIDHDIPEHGCPVCAGAPPPGLDGGPCPRCHGPALPAGRAPDTEVVSVEIAVRGPRGPRQNHP
jgi:hydrogenase nickel incorporation protein HypA/HybF